MPKKPLSKASNLKGLLWLNAQQVNRLVGSVHLSAKHLCIPILHKPVVN
jgi:hypothetical protein